MILQTVRNGTVLLPAEMLPLTAEFVVIRAVGSLIWKIACAISVILVIYIVKLIERK